MERNKPIKCKYGYAESEILSYHSEADNLMVFLKCWNEKILKFQFTECILFLILNSWKISNLCETDNSFLYERALNIVFDKTPKEHNYKLFQFLDEDDNIVVEIGAKDVIISETTDLAKDSN